MLPKKLSWEASQTTWSQQLDPIIANPTVNNILLKSVRLVTGANVINHRLGRKLQGWYTTRVRALSTIYDAQDTNQMPELTLVLISSADVVVDLSVF